ncbi:hypothetical protein BC829DRAFT_425667 [Chytridium lagenaria]|nr:hypothetical protein BC829DRAFT_425667 [Chytridium lagenaria]
MLPKSTFQKIERPPHTTYEKIVFALDILVPPEEPEDMEVPHGHFLQKVIIGPRWRWRVAKDENNTLPDYLTNHLDKKDTYRVYMERKRGVPLMDPASKFIRRWDALTLVLLLFTASVTPFETAFIESDGNIDFLFLINRIVDIIFMIDLFIQIRLPYRDPNTGKYVSDPKSIAYNYIMSCQLRLLRFFRLMRLLKLLRVLRASRKLRQWQATVNLRYATMQVLQYSVFIIFLIHWLACGFRLAATKNDPGDTPGWIESYAQSKNSSLNDIPASSVSLIGPSMVSIQPASIREYGYQIFAAFVSYMNAVYFIAIISDVLSISSRASRVNELEVDKYMEMFSKLKLDPRLKIKVHNYLSEKFALDEASGFTTLLRNLPHQLHGFISMEIFLEFVEEIPFLVPFIEREPGLIQELCRTVEIQSFPPNSHVFSEGFEGIYYVERGLCAIEGRIYSANNKQAECRALTTVTVHIISRKNLLEQLEKNPKILYFAKRWTAWAVLRSYILTYSKLYYTAARRGATFNPPLLTKRPFLQENEFDDIDLAVVDHINETGF